MNEAHNIISTVQNAYKRVVANLARLTGKTTETFHSHAREPKTHNPMSSGNVSPLTHWMLYCRQYEASEKGAGRMMNNRAHAELEMEFAESDAAGCQKKYHAGILKESFDVLHCFNEYEFEKEDLPTLALAEEEAAQLRDEASDLVSHIRSIRRNKNEEK